MLKKETTREGRLGADVVLLLCSLPVALLTVICIRYIDIPVSLFVQTHLFGNSTWSHLASDIPDTLLIMVVVISALSYAFFLLRKRSRGYDATTFLFRSVALSLPAAFVTKSVLKVIFGRIETRVWLHDPQLYGFHWFHGGPQFGGFPSGHMAVFATLFATIWRNQPRLKALLWPLLTAMGLLLIVTNYHFLSDVVCGAYLGLLVEAVMFAVMGRNGAGSPRCPDRS